MKTYDQSCKPAGLGSPVKGRLTDKRRQAKAGPSMQYTRGALKSIVAVLHQDIGQLQVGLSACIISAYSSKSTCIFQANVVGDLLCKV